MMMLDKKMYDLIIMSAIFQAFWATGHIVLTSIKNAIALLILYADDVIFSPNVVLFSSAEFMLHNIERWMCERVK